MFKLHRIAIVALSNKEKLAGLGEEGKGGDGGNN